VLLGAAEDVAWLDVPVGVPEAVQFAQRTHSMAQRLQTKALSQPVTAMHA